MSEITEGLFWERVAPNQKERNVRLGTATLTISGPKLKTMELTHILAGRKGPPGFVIEESRIVLPPGATAGFSVTTSESQFALVAKHVASWNSSNVSRIVVLTGQSIDELGGETGEYLDIRNGIITLINPYTESNVKIRGLNFHCDVETL